jgi:SAM-dependent methyltransferase
MCMYITFFAVTVVLEAIVFAVGAMLCVSMYRARKSAAPFYPTPKAAIRAALKEVSLAPGELFYDLGAGTGKALVIAEKEFGAQATGFEISLIPYWIAKINLFLRRSHAKLYAKNFFTQNLHDADVVFCFLAIRTMQKTENKLKAELKPGARIIIYAFPLPDMTPIKTITVHGQWKMFIYSID